MIIDVITDVISFARLLKISIGQAFFLAPYQRSLNFNTHQFSMQLTKFDSQILHTYSLVQGLQGRPSSHQTGRSLCLSFFLQPAEKLIFFQFEFSLSGTKKIIEKHNLSPIMKIKCFSKTERNFHFEKMLISLSFLDLLTLHFG